MDMNTAILGMLEWKPMSGYDIKRAMQNSLFMHWSGNNNQIYKVLVQLATGGMIAGEVCNQETGPSKKVYHITQEGRNSLKECLLKTQPELPEYRKLFLTQLAWSDCLKTDQILGLVKNYEEQLGIQVKMRQELKRRAQDFPSRTEREIYIWNMICDNMIRSFEAELAWSGQLYSGLISYMQNEDGADYK